MQNYPLESSGVASSVAVREVRVAVSMVGGVSLAIYENGIAQELFRMVHGRGLYGVLKRITHSHAYVDVLSGTSAGGINGIFLSTALCADTDLWSTHDDWVRLGSIEALMQPPQEKDVRSLFQGNDYYYPQLQGVFEKLLDTRSNPCRWLKDGKGVLSGRDPATGKYGNLDLFVTGTHFRPQPLVFFDARTQPIYNNDFAGVFALKHRPRRGTNGESHFDPRAEEPQLPKDGTTSPFGKNQSTRCAALRDRLARVARTTSSLPAVFETSEVDAKLMNGIIDLPGSMASTFMGDGGYLNNRPLNLVLSAILKRGANREVTRKILFVEPVATEGENVQGDLEEPDAIKHGLLALTVSQNQNLKETLDTLYEHNRKVRYITEALDAARDKAKHTRVMSPVERDLWVRLRLQELRDAVIDQWGEALRLSLFKGTQKLNNSGKNTPLNIADKVREDAAALSEMRTRLLVLLEDHCADLTTPTAVPAPANFIPLAAANVPPVKFSLAQIDSFYLRRTALRTGQELYDGLFNNSAPLEPRNPHFKTIQDYLSECFHIEALARLIERNVTPVLQALTQTAEYECVRDYLSTGVTNGKRINNSLLNLWWLCVSSLHVLLDIAPPLTKPGAKSCPVPTEIPTLYTGIAELPQERQEREQGNLEQIDSVLKERSKWICEVLTEKRNQAQRDDWKSNAGRWANNATILEILDKYLHDLLIQGAAELNALRGAMLGVAAGTNKENKALVWTLARPALQTSQISKIDSPMAVLDSCLFPLERAADLACSNNLELVQISARDVQTGLSARPPSQKLGGDMLGNLSGFLKASWRVNDLMWGRLDGAGALLDTLFDYQRLRTLLKADRTAAIKIILAVDRYIRYGAARSSNQLLMPDPVGQYLLANKSTDPEENWLIARPAIELWLRKRPPEFPLVSQHCKEFELLRRWLLKRHQLEILCDEVPEVLTMAIAEQAEWQGTGLAAPSEALDELLVNTPPPTKTPKIGLLTKIVGGLPDTTTRGLVIKQIRSWVGERFGKDTVNNPYDVKEIANFFETDYKVGGETLGSIPAVVTVRRLLAMVTVGLRVASNSLPAHLGTSGPSVTVNRLLRFGAWLSNLLYGLVTALAQGKIYVVALLTFCWALLLMSGAVLWWKWGASGKTSIFVAIILGALTIIALTRWYQAQIDDREQAEDAPGNQYVAWIGIVGCSMAAHSLVNSVLPNSTSPVLARWLWAGTIVFMGVLSLLDRPLKDSGAQCGIVAFELAGSARRATRIVRSWGAKRWAAWGSLILDFVYIGFYSLLLYILTRQATGSYVPWVQGMKPSGDSLKYVVQFQPTISLVLERAPILAGLLDCAENICLLILLRTTKDVTPGAQAKVGNPQDGRFALRSYFAPCARTFALTKFSLLIVAIIYILGGLYLWYVTPNILAGP